MHPKKLLLNNIYRTMAIRVTYRPKYSSLVSAQPDQKSPIYNWHSFKHSFSRQLVQELISEFGLKKGSWILDPFCGGGTTLLSSQQLNINSQGIDILPFAVFLSNVKTHYYDESTLLQGLKKLRQNSNENLNIKIKLSNDISILDKAFPTPIKSELLKLKQELDVIQDRHYRDFFNLAFLSILESVSNTSKDGGFLRIVDRNVSPESVRMKFLDKCASMISDVIKNNKMYKQNGIKASAKLGDARKLPVRRQFDAIITSPPYPNRHDYTRIYLLEMVFDFVSNNQELKQIRYNTLRSHVEAKKRFEPNGYEQPAKLTGLIQKIEKNGVNNPQVTDMIEGYFEDMYLSLQEMQKRLVKRGKVGLVVSNVRFAGVNIPVDKLLCDIGIQAGLKPKAIWTARKRGNSAQQMKRYKRNPSRESIVVWEK